MSDMYTKAGVYEPSVEAHRCADRLLSMLHYLVRATHDGGQASELHLRALLEDTELLLHEVGGFEDTMHRYRDRG